MQSLKEILQRKSAGAPGQRLQWEQAATAHPYFSTAQSLRLVTEATSPTQLLSIAELAQTLPPDDLHRQIEEAVDESDHSLAEWLEALALMRSHARRTSRKLSLQQAIGYLDCCSAASPGADLASTVAEMLDRYGIED